MAYTGGKRFAQEEQHAPITDEIILSMVERFERSNRRDDWNEKTVVGEMPTARARTARPPVIESPSRSSSFVLEGRSVKERLLSAPSDSPKTEHAERTRQKRSKLEVWLTVAGFFALLFGVAAHSDQVVRAARICMLLLR